MISQARALGLPPGLAPSQARQYWRAGFLGWALTPTGQKMRKAYYAAKAAKVGEQVWAVARRCSKTHTMVHTAFETNLLTRGARTPFAAQTGKEVEQIIRPMVETLLLSCPKSLLPKDNWYKGEIRFKNGSVLPIAGCDNGHYATLRGTFATAWFFDEAGFVDPYAFSELVDGIFRQQTWTTGGLGVIASNPSDVAVHPFKTRYLIAKEAGRSQHYTFWEAEIVSRMDGHYLSQEEKEHLVADHAKSLRLTVEEFKRTTKYKREYLAEFVAEEERAILREYTEDMEKVLMKEPESPPLWADRYTCIDTGGGRRDWTAILYGYWDFARQKLVVVRDRILRQPSRMDICRALYEDEVGTELKPGVFPVVKDAGGRRVLGAGMPKTQHFRIMDGSEILQRDLAAITKDDAGLEWGGYVFQQTARDDLESAIKTVRDWIVEEKIELDPAVRDLSTQMHAGVWNKRRTEFDRIEGFGHFDLVAALIYLVRNVRPNMDRLPRLYGVDRENTFVRPESKDRGPDGALRGDDALAAMFGVGDDEGYG